ncbi:hypothetical protein NE865_03307 [Phthorimaea operculella]|nr:hypothetical protein NE865_03307 [Phthorimaea operculella]
MVCLAELQDEIKTKIDVMCITEHNMSDGLGRDLVHVQNYTIAASYARNNSRGGACILLRNGHQYRELPEISKISVCGIFECCAIELIKLKLIILCVYRSPKYSKKYLKLFFEKLDYALSKVSKKSHTVILCGDFNVNILNNNNITHEFINILQNYNFKLLLKQVTRPSSGTCIDNIAINNNSLCDVYEFAISDHTAQVLKLPAKSTCVIDYWRVKRRDFSNMNLSKFRHCIENISFSDIYHSNDPNESYEIFLYIFKLFFNLCFPFTDVKIKAHKTAKWISHGIKKSSRRKRSLLWKYRFKSNKFNELKYKTYTKIFRQVMKQSQRDHNINVMKRSDNAIRSAWQIINRSKHNRPKEFISRLRLNDTYITDQQKIADSFNDNYVNKVTRHPGTGSNVDLNHISCPNSMFMQPSSPSDILNIIRSLKNKSSVGYDEISTKVVKHVADCIAPHLSYIINLCISSGTFPDRLKIAVVKPLFKNKDREDMSCYRPIYIRTWKINPCFQMNSKALEKKDPQI